MGDDTHVTDIGGLVHETTDLIDGEVARIDEIWMLAKRD
jgi:hypothetical protein